MNNFYTIKQGVRADVGLEFYEDIKGTCISELLSGGYEARAVLLDGDDNVVDGSELTVAGGGVVMADAAPNVVLSWAAIYTAGLAEFDGRCKVELELAGEVVERIFFAVRCVDDPEQ